MYDAIVIGARCAGAATAMLLARKEHKVLLVDRATFTSDIAHGHFIHRQGPRYLRDWGLLHRIVQSNCPAVTKFTMDVGDFPMTGTELEEDGVAFGYAPRRRVLDRILIDAAIEAGAEFRPGFSVTGYLDDNGVVAGIRERNGIEERARIVIGADGRNSPLALAVHAPLVEANGRLMCWYFSYWSDMPMDGLEVYVRPPCVLFAFPTNDGLTAIFIGWALSEFQRVRSGIEEAFLDAIGRVPGLAERVHSGRRAERFYGTADLPNFIRKPYGPGWALVGDAGCHKDPYLALGICDAFRDADLLSTAVHDALAGNRPFAEALEEFEVRRDEANLPGYRENLFLAGFNPMPPDLLRMRQSIRDNAQATRMFFMAREGMIPAAPISARASG